MAITKVSTALIQAANVFSVTVGSANSIPVITFDEAGTIVSVSNASVVGATGGGSDQVFYENDQVVTTNYTITTGKNAMSAGNITIQSGVTVNITGNSRWIIV